MARVRDQSQIRKREFKVLNIFHFITGMVLVLFFLKLLASHYTINYKAQGFKNSRIMAPKMNKRRECIKESDFYVKIVPRSLEYERNIFQFSLH